VWVATLHMSRRHTAIALTNSVREVASAPTMTYASRAQDRHAQLGSRLRLSAQERDA
jgi:hypothetical protein